MKLTYEERNIWWDAYCSVVNGLYTNTEGWTYAGADDSAAYAADLALARWRKIEVVEPVEVSP